MSGLLEMHMSPFPEMKFETYAGRYQRRRLRLTCDRLAQRRRRRSLKMVPQLAALDRHGAGSATRLARRLNLAETLLPLRRARSVCLRYRSWQTQPSAGCVRCLRTTQMLWAIASTVSFAAIPPGDPSLSWSDQKAPGGLPLRALQPGRPALRQMAAMPEKTSFTASFFGTK